MAKLMFMTAALHCFGGDPVTGEDYGMERRECIIKEKKRPKEIGPNLIFYGENNERN